MSGEGRQYMLSDYQLKQVDVRLKLSDNRTYYSEDPITDADSAVRFMAGILKDLDREWVCVLNLDSKMRAINFNVVSIGSVDRAIAPIQNIMKSGLLSGAANILLLHTHPSGDPTPSSEDLMLTKKTVLAGKLMDLPVIDHVIAAGGTGLIFSIRSEFPELFTSEISDREASEMIDGSKKRQRGRDR